MIDKEEFPESFFNDTQIDDVCDDEVCDSLPPEENEDENEDEYDNNDDESPLYHAKNIIDDNFELGKEFFSVTCNVSGDTDGKKSLLAVSFRDYAKRNKPTANGVRFVANMEENIMKKFTHTMCMERLHVSADTDK